MPPTPTVIDLPIDSIQSRPQVRQEFDAGKLEELAASVRQVGLQQPIRVYAEGEHYVIVLGERRFRAAKLAGLTTVPAMVVDRPATEAERIQLQLIENVQRADLSHREKSEAIQELLTTPGMTNTKAATLLGLSAATVTRLLALPTLPEAIQSGVDNGKIPLSAAYELSQVKDLSRQNELAEQLIQGNLTRDGLTAARKATARPSTPAGKSVVVAVGNGQTMTLAGRPPSSIEELIAMLEDVLTRARRARPQSLSLATFLRILKEQAKA